MDSTSDSFKGLPGDGYIRMEFNLIVIAMVSIAVHHKHQILQSHSGVIPIVVHLLSTVFLLYGRIQQKEVLSQNKWLREYDPLDYQSVCGSAAEQEETYNFLQFSMVAWLASGLFDAKIIQFIHKDIIEIVHNIGHSPSIYKLLVANALIVIILSSTMEITFVCSISGDWNLFVYMLLSISSRIVRTIIQGHMYLSGEGRPIEQLPLFLTMIATVIIPITNVLTIYAYWKPVHPAFLWTLLLAVMLDIFYHIALLNWYFNGVGRNGNNLAPPEPQPADDSPDDHHELHQTDNGQLDQQNVKPAEVEVEAGIPDSLETSVNVNDDKSNLIFVNVLIE